MVSLSSYVLATFKRQSAFSTEAGLKYFILGAFSSGLLLFGSSMVYGLTGTTNFGNINTFLSFPETIFFIFNRFSHWSIIYRYGIIV